MEHMSDTLLVLRGRLVLSDSIIDDGVVVIRGESIVGVGPTEDHVDCPTCGEAVRATEHSGRTYLPGLVDVHCHGGGGESFPNSTTREQAMVAVLEHRRHGTTSLVASTVTASADVLLERARLLGALAEEGEIAGIHFEGPFVSCERKGAQDPEFIIAPDADLTRRLIDASGGHTVTMTVAPEKEGAWGPGSVGEALIDGGALPSWGHTDSAPLPARGALAWSRDKLAATESRRSDRATVTHLFNGMRPLHHRDPGPIAEFLADGSTGGAIVEMICDGVHLDPAIVRDVYVMLGRDQCVFVTDAMAAAGMADGSYQLGPQAVRVEGGVARLAHGDSIAGGTAHLLDCVRVAVHRAGIDLVDAVHMASAQGARILGEDRVGRLASGCFADVVEVDDDLRALRVWRRGVLVD